ncbi:hypothetical protein HX049_05600 [Myroides odoratimimus]|uniref:hypothetical protein n=1 Tax=Myroides odoratimimus TaxID=76832 RepID=UPI00257562A6|nr:hypothetical protein [Myroides odoratimimus]MDM1396645.1 hypothetical protein [Myroides odoratimimus]
MKKVLEGELLSLAHRVLQLKDKEVDSLYREAKELYEKLTILKFYQDHFEAGLMKDVSPEQLDNALKAMAINNSNSNTVDEVVRHQMPIDLVEEEYPIVAETEKEAINTIDESLLADKVSKIVPEVVEEAPVAQKKVMYDEPFITEVYIDDSANEADDAQLHHYLDQHEAMLKQLDEREVIANTAVENPVVEQEVVAHTTSEIPVVEEEEEEDNDDVEVTTFYEEEVVVKEEVIETPIPSTVEAAKEESIEEALVNINEQFAPAKIEDTLEETTITANYKVEEEVKTVTENKPNTDDPFFGFDFSDVEFVRVEDVDKQEVQKFDTEFVPKEPVVEASFTQPEPIAPVEQHIESTVETPVPQSTLFNVEHTSVREPKINKPKSINDIYSSTIVVGLNDRIAFERHLFNGSAEDFNRVLSQLNTVSSFDEANSLIDHLVKPEYNNWEGKEEYEERFMTLVEKRFI